MATCSAGEHLLVRCLAAESSAAEGPDGQVNAGAEKGRTSVQQVSHSLP